MQIGAGEHSYEWIDDWARIPASEESLANGRTHGVVVTRSGSVLVFHIGKPALLEFSPGGTFLGGWGDRFPGAHGLTLVTEGGREYLWLTDYVTGEVVKTTLQGETLMTLPRAPLKIYEDGGRYAPTWVAVHEQRHGGNGDIWVADGYGSWYVHRYDKSGNYLESLNGSKGIAGTFHHPHGIWIDLRKSEPELYVADRFNRRVQVFDLDGQYKRVWGESAGLSACMFTAVGDWLVIPEAPYRARLTVLDPTDAVVCILGENDGVCIKDGFPNDRGLVKPGFFNTPHDVAADAVGNLYVVEWITGGRITKLAKL